MSTTKFYSLTFAIGLALAILFNIYLASGCRSGSGVITSSGKVCAL